MIGVDKVLNIKKATIEDLDEIINAYNQVAKELIDKDVHQWKYPFSKDKLLKEIIDQKIYIFEKNQMMIGCFGLENMPKDFPVNVKKDSLYLSKLMIKINYQSQGYGKQLIKHLRKWYTKKEVYFNCWAGNEKLNEFYTNHQCKNLGQYKEENYYINIYQI